MMIDVSEGDLCPVPVMRHAWVEHDLGYTKRTVHDVVEQPCGNGIPCVHHGSALMINGLMLRLTKAQCDAWLVNRTPAV